MGIAASFDDSIRQRLAFYNTFFFTHMKILPSLRASRKYLAEATTILMFEKIAKESLNLGQQTIESLLSAKEDDSDEKSVIIETPIMKQAKK
jgi:hypothetical protein